MLRTSVNPSIGEPRTGSLPLTLLLGGIAWAALVLVKPALVVWILVLGPTIIVPLGLELIRARLSSGLERRAIEIGRWLWAPAVLGFVASFWFEQGLIAATLAVPWLVTTLVLSLAGVGLLWRVGWPVNRSTAMVAALLLLPVGAGWVVLSRAGLRPQDFSHEIVLLTGVHFHFAGFALPILAGLAVGSRTLRWGKLLLATIVLGVPAVGVGISLSPHIEVGAAIILAGASLTVAWLQAREGFRSRNGNRAMLQLISSVALAAAMGLAGVYAVGEFTGATWLSIPVMIQTHGVLNAFGFALCGLAARVLERNVPATD